MTWGTPYKVKEDKCIVHIFVFISVVYNEWTLGSVVEDKTVLERTHKTG